MEPPILLFLVEKFHLSADWSNCKCFSEREIESKISTAIWTIEIFIQRSFRDISLVEKNDRIVCTRGNENASKNITKTDRIDADNPTIFYNQSLRGDKFSQKKLTKHGRRRNSYSLKPFRKFRVFSNKLFSS